MVVKKIYCVALLIIIFCSSCDILPVIRTPTSIPDTATPSPTFVPTATIMWFPPTVTPTPAEIIIVTPTPDQLPELGDLIFQDPLSHSGSWQTARSAEGGVAFGNNELTVTVAKAKGYIFSLRNAPVLDDFYMEVTSISSLCRQTDSYGVVFRALGGGNYYRFVISCAGTVSMERENGGYTINISGNVPSGEAHPGPETALRLGLLAQGKVFRFFINGVYQFTVSDPSFSHGTIGFFARSGGDTAVTVSFKDLAVNNLR